MPVTHVLCFLIMDFLHPSWQSWLASDPTWGAVVHAKDHLVLPECSWFLPLCVPSIPTGWGTPGAVHAELLMYKIARERYPQAQYFCFLSGDTVALFNALKTRQDITALNKSVVYDDADDGAATAWTIASPAGMPRPICSHANKLLCREHVDLLLDNVVAQQRLNVLLALPNTAWHDAMFQNNAMWDEIVIGTVLYSMVPPATLWNSYIVYFALDPGQRHPITFKTQTPRFKKEVIKARRIGSNVWFFRKVSAPTYKIK